MELDGENRPATRETATQPKPGLVPRVANVAAVTVVGIAFVGLAGAGIAALNHSAAIDPRSKPAQPVGVTAITVEQKSSYRTTVTYSGIIEAARQTALAFERAGLVVAVDKDEGDPVHTGDVIARLDTSQLIANRDRLLARQRELEAQLDLARLTRGRLNGLSQRGWTPEQRQDEADASVTRLTAAVAGIAAEVKALDIDIAKSVLRAPFDGNVTARAIDEGAVVAAGTSIVTLAETGRLQARIGLPPAIAAALDLDRTYHLDALGLRLDARVVAKRPDLAAVTRTVPVLFAITEPPHGVPVGEVASLTLERHIDEVGVWLPLTALKEGRRGIWTALVVSETGSQSVVAPVSIEILHVTDGRAFVRGSLRDGDRVVAAGTNRIVAGQRVALKSE